MALSHVCECGAAFDNSQKLGGHKRSHECPVHSKRTLQPRALPKEYRCFYCKQIKVSASRGCAGRVATGTRGSATR